MLVGERSPTENGQGGKDDQGRIEQNKSGLGDKTVFEEDQAGAHCSSDSLAS